MTSREVDWPGRVSADLVHLDFLHHVPTRDSHGALQGRNGGRLGRVVVNQMEKPSLPCVLLDKVCDQEIRSRDLKGQVRVGGPADRGDEFLPVTRALPKPVADVEIRLTFGEGAVEFDRGPINYAAFSEHLP